MKGDQYQTSRDGTTDDDPINCKRTIDCKEKHRKDERKGTWTLGRLSSYSRYLDRLLPFFSVAVVVCVVFAAAGRCDGTTARRNFPIRVRAS